MNLLKSFIILAGISIGTQAGAFSFTDVYITNQDKSDAVCSILIGNTHGGASQVTTGFAPASSKSHAIRIPFIDVAKGDYIRVECAQDGNLSKNDIIYTSVPHNWVTICDEKNPCLPTGSDTAYNVADVTLMPCFSSLKK